MVSLTQDMPSESGISLMVHLIQGMPSDRCISLAA